MLFLDFDKKIIILEYCNVTEIINIMKVSKLLYNFITDNDEIVWGKIAKSMPNNSLIVQSDTNMEIVIKYLGLLFKNMEREWLAYYFNSNPTYFLGTHIENDHAILANYINHCKKIFVKAHAYELEATWKNV
jgi:hypothetical protein